MCYNKYTKGEEPQEREENSMANKATCITTVRVEKGVIHATADNGKEILIDFNNNTIYGLTGKPVGSSPLVRRYIRDLSYSQTKNLPMLFKILYQRQYNSDIEVNFRLMKYADRLANMGYNEKRISSIISHYNGWRREFACKLDDNATYKEIAKVIKFMPIDDYHKAYAEYQIELFKQSCQKALVGANLTEPDIDFIYDKFYRANSEITKKYLYYIVDWVAFRELRYYWDMLCHYYSNRAFKSPIEYLEICEKLNIEPEKKDFYKHMATTYKAWQLAKDAHLNEEIARRQAESKAKVFYENELFTMVFPMTAAEFTIEGDALNNCLGWNGYAEKVAQGKHIIAFVRYKAKVNKPYIACDITKNGYGKLHINQFYGMNNNTPDDVRAMEYKQELAEFLKKIS
jgi:hypothetical protein